MGGTFSKSHNLPLTDGIYQNVACADIMTARDAEGNTTFARVWYPTDFVSFLLCHPTYHKYIYTLVSFSNYSRPQHPSPTCRIAASTLTEWQNTRDPCEFPCDSHFPSMPDAPQSTLNGTDHYCTVAFVNLWTL